MNKVVIDMSTVGPDEIRSVTCSTTPTTESSWTEISPTCTPAATDCFSKDVDSSPSTLVSEAAANTSNAGCCLSAACPGANAVTARIAVAIDTRMRWARIFIRPCSTLSCSGARAGCRTCGPAIYNGIVRNVDRRRRDAGYVGRGSARGAGGVCA